MAPVPDVMLPPAARSETVHEEAMLTVGAFTYACGRQFGKYIQAFFPYLIRGLQNYQEWQVRCGEHAPHRGGVLPAAASTP